MNGPVVTHRRAFGIFFSVIVAFGAPMSHADECTSCTARHKSLQALQDARTARDPALPQAEALLPPSSAVAQASSYASTEAPSPSAPTGPAKK